MSLQETNIIKGYAIIMMVILHLFCDPSACSYLLFWKGYPILTFLTQGLSPVPFFLVLSGYGQYIAYKRGDKNRFIRIERLFLHYVFFFILFFSIGRIIKQDRFNVSIATIIRNLLSYDTSLAPICWFVFPYMILSLIGKYLFLFLEKMRESILLPFFLVVYFSSSFAISRYSSQLQSISIFLYQLVVVLSFVFPYILGAVAYRHHVFEMIINTIQSKTSALILIAILFLLRALFNSRSLDAFYAFIMIPFLLIVTTNPRIRVGLVFIGKESMNIWLIHGWIAYYLFGDYLYSLKYPLPIFLVCFVSSLILSRLCEPCINWLERPIMSFSRNEG